MSEEIPDDIRGEARKVFERVAASDWIEAEATIAAALLAERRAQIERDCAIALQRTAQLANDSDMTRGYSEGRKAAAAAIRSQIKSVAD